MARSVLVQAEFGVRAVLVGLEPRQALCCVDARQNRSLLHWLGSMGRRDFTPRRQTASQLHRARVALVGFWWAVTGEVCSSKGSQQRRRHQRCLKKLAVRGTKQAGSTEQG